MAELANTPDDCDILICNSIPNPLAEQNSPPYHVENDANYSKEDMTRMFNRSSQILRESEDKKEIREEITYLMDFEGVRFGYKPEAKFISFRE